MIENSSVQVSSVSHHYDELDEFYREHWGVHLHHGLWEKPGISKEEAVIELSLKVLSYFEPHSKLLDIGCGYGETARLALAMGADDVTGITVSRKQFEYAAAHPRKGARFHLGDFMQHRFASKSFDGAYSIECFEHIKDKSRYFEQVRRVLKPGGKFVMMAWLAGDEPSVWEKRHLLGPICEEGRLPSLCTRSEVLKLIQDSGMELLEETDLSQKVWKTWLISSKEVLKLFKESKGLKYFFNRNHRERRFALTVPRILMGYRTGAFKYGLFVMQAARSAS